VVVLDRRFAHHSERSGYGQLVRRQPGVEYLQELRIPARGGDRVARRAARGAHTRTSLGFELAAARRMAARPRALFHVLYGEDDYHHLARAAPLLRRRGGKLIATFHQPPDLFDWAMPAPCAQRILPRLDAAVVTTAEQAAHLERWIASVRIHHIGHGVDTAYFSPGRDDASRERPFTVITVGNWQRDYTLYHQVVGAFGGPGSGVRFVLVAAPEIVGRLGGLPGVEAHCGISDDELRARYRQSDVLFLPVVQAAANNTLMEAMACGLPVVATDLPGIREYACAGARLFPRGGTREAIDALGAVRSLPISERARLGARARERALELDFAVPARRLAELYARLALR
jgi:glycosyltransferase involved in cell wall biosynthesis